MHPVLIGSIVWLIIGILVGYKIVQHVGNSSAEDRKWYNQKVALVSVIMSGLSMWLMWATCYMHQMYPLIEPKMEF